LEKYKLAAMISTSVTKVSPPARNVKRYGFLALHGSPRGPDGGHNKTDPDSERDLENPVSHRSIGGPEI
jgi:hypothetical protein